MCNCHATVYQAFSLRSILRSWVQFIMGHHSRNGEDQQELEKVVTEKLSSFIISLMKEYFKLTEARIELEV